jgi:hypothetical protein
MYILRISEHSVEFSGYVSVTPSLPKGGGNARGAPLDPRFVLKIFHGTPFFAFEMVKYMDAKNAIF